MFTRRVQVSDATTMSGLRFPGTGSVITTPVASCGPLFVTVITYGRSAPSAMLLGAVIVIARSAPAPAVTVKAPVFNTVAVPKAGVIAVEPAATPVASPGLVVLIVAKPVGTVVQVTRLVMSFSVPSLKFPTALNCCVCPTAIDAVVGVTAIDCNVAFAPVPIENTTTSSSGIPGLGGLQLVQVVWKPFTVVVGFVFAKNPPGAFDSPAA
jgi:hypothetical protein